MQLTVFTPAYNRADLLVRCYESMKRQTEQRFVWMIIDDGSTDHTKELVQSWKKEGQGFKLEYYYKENGKTFIVKNPTAAEKFLAKATRKTGKKVVGYRKESEYVEDTTELKKRLESLNAEQEIELEFE